MSNLNGRVSQLERGIGPAVAGDILPPVAWYDAIGELAAVWQFQPTGHLYEYRYKDGDHRFSSRPRWTVCTLVDVAQLDQFILMEYAYVSCYRRGLPDHRHYGGLADGEGLVGGPMPEAWRDPLLTLDPDQWLMDCPPLPPLDNRLMVYLNGGGRYNRGVIYEDRKPAYCDVFDVWKIRGDAT